GGGRGGVFLRAFGGVLAGGEGEHARGGNDNELGVQDVSPVQGRDGYRVRPRSPRGRSGIVQKQMFKKRKSRRMAAAFPMQPGSARLRVGILGGVFGVLGSVFHGLGRVGSGVGGFGRGRGSSVGSGIGSGVGGGSGFVGGGLRGGFGRGAGGLGCLGGGVGGGVSGVGGGVLGLLLVAARGQGKAQGQREQCLVDGHSGVFLVVKKWKRARLRAPNMMTSR